MVPRKCYISFRAESTSTRRDSLHFAGVRRTTANRRQAPRVGNASARHERTTRSLELAWDLTWFSWYKTIEFLMVFESITNGYNPLSQSKSMAFSLASGIKNAANEPILTGTLLYLLTRGPLHIRERLLRPFQTNILSTNGAARLATLITVLKVLTGVGVVKRVNQALNRLAWNNWTLGRPGAAFKFGPRKEELIIITGGSSGFGYEMVKGFSKVARVVVLDIQAFPAELAKCKHEWSHCGT